MATQTKTVSNNELKLILTEWIDTRKPIQLRKKNGEFLICFLRGFADTQREIFLISDTPDTLSMNILEIRNIDAVIPSVWE